MFMNNILLVSTKKGKSEMLRRACVLCVSHIEIAAGKIGSAYEVLHYMKNIEFHNGADKMMKCVCPC